MLKESYCDCLLSVNIFSSVTSGSAFSQWSRQNSFKFLGSMQNSGFQGNETKKTLQILLLPNWLADFQIIYDPLSYFFKPCWFVKKHGRQGQGCFALHGYRENLKKSSPTKVSGWFSNNPRVTWPFIRFLQAMLIGRKLWQNKNKKNQVSNSRALLFGKCYVHICQANF